MEETRVSQSKSHPVILIASLLLCLSTADAALVTNPASTIIGRVTIQPIVVSDNNGTNTANYLGSPSQQSNILNLVDDIWAQAGLDIEFLSANSWNSSFANEGSTAPRPQSDLGSILSSGASAGVTNSDPNVLNMFFVNVVPGFNILGGNNAAGLAFIDGNGIAQYVGGNLLGFTGGWETVASVVAHEIGHNLGLLHNTIDQNLMASGSNVADGERLNAAQIVNVLDSQFVVAAAPVPLPAAAWLLLSAIAGVCSTVHLRNAVVGNKQRGVPRSFAAAQIARG